MGIDGVDGIELVGRKMQTEGVLDSRDSLAVEARLRPGPRLRLGPVQVLKRAPSPRETGTEASTLRETSARLALWDLP